MGSEGLSEYFAERFQSYAPRYAFTTSTAGQSWKIWPLTVSFSLGGGSKIRDFTSEEIQADVGGRASFHNYPAKMVVLDVKELFAGDDFNIEYGRKHNEVIKKWRVLLSQVKFPGEF